MRNAPRLSVTSVSLRPSSVSIVTVAPGSGLLLESVTRPARTGVTAKSSIRKVLNITFCIGKGGGPSFLEAVPCFRYRFPSNMNNFGRQDVRDLAKLVNHILADRIIDEQKSERFAALELTT